MPNESTNEILADPFAPPDRWMRAWAAAGKQPPALVKARTDGIVLSFFLAGSTSAFAMFGYDWGREVLEEILRSNVQFTTAYVVAASINMGVVLPAAYGLFSGYLTDEKKGRLALSSWVFVSTLVFLSQIQLVNQIWSTNPLLISLYLIGPVLALGTFKLGRIVKEQIKGKTIVQRVFRPALWYLIPSAILLLFNLDGNFGFREEVWVFCGTLFIAAARAARRCRATRAEAGLSAAFFVSLPVIMINIINIISNIVLLSIDTQAIAWQALGATLIVTGCTTTSAAAGGLWGTLRTRLIARRQRLLS